MPVQLRQTPPSMLAAAATLSAAERIAAGSMRIAPAALIAFVAPNLVVFMKRSPSARAGKSRAGTGARRPMCALISYND